MFNQIVVQEEGKAILDELQIKTKNTMRIIIWPRRSKLSVGSVYRP